MELLVSDASFPHGIKILEFGMNGLGRSVGASVPKEIQDCRSCNLVDSASAGLVQEWRPPPLPLLLHMTG